MKVIMDCNIILDRAYACRELVTTTKEHYEMWLKKHCKVIDWGEAQIPVIIEPVEEIEEAPIEETKEKFTESPKNKMSQSGKKK